MKLKYLFEVALKLLSLKNDNHSITQSICRQHLFDTNCDPNALAQTFLEAVGNQNCSANFVDWLNTLLFNVCSVNQQLIAHYQNKMLESTGDAPKYMQKDGKMVASSVEVAVHIRSTLKKWLQRVVTLPFIQRILQEVNKKSVTKSKSLRSFLQTLDYLFYKYQVSIHQKQQFSTILASFDRKNQAALMLQRATWTNKRLFSGAEHLVAFLSEIADNYTICIVSVATIISANYFHSNLIRKPFESAINCGEVIVEEIADFLIRKCNKNDLFSERMDSYRPFELFMQVIFQKFSSVLLQFNQVITSLMINGQVSLYHMQNHKKIQAISTLFSYQIQIAYPRFHHLLTYIHTSLLAKYSPLESLQLMKKFILNRFLLNPFYFALLNSPSQQEMQKYVRVANEARILFYQKKIDSIPQQFRNARLSQHAQLLRKSLFSMLNAKQTVTIDEQARCDKGIYINDTLLGALYFQVSDTLKGMKQVKPNNSELHSQSSLSFSLRNDSASRMQISSQQNLTATYNNSTTIPQLPKPRTSREDFSQRNASKIVSTDANFQQREIPVDHLTELVNLRRQYGQLKDQIQLRSHHRADRRNNWKRQLHLLHQPVSTIINDLSKASSQLMIHSLLL